MSSTKTSKAMLSRLRKTKNGKVLARGKGRGHFNSKHPRSKKLIQKRQSGITVSKKVDQRYFI